MNKALLVFLASALLVAIGLSAAEKTATWEGTLVDANCYLKDNSLTGNDHMGVKECGTMCLKSGLPAGLLTKDKRFHAIIAPSLALAPYVGQQVRISGSLHSGAILAEKAEVQKNGKWEAINIKAMM
ncbi:MAG TPA: hypothetical protein VEU62_07460 [Bryobacterales bacterium]|nr:hypothetical protein [Bryobacterales bacterium]